jgi:deoxycytidylate deaminase
VYYEAFKAAQSSDHVFKLAAFADKRSGIFGINNRGRLTSHFRRRYKNSDGCSYDKHAEVDLILKLSYTPKKITVVRFRSDGSFTMAKPCVHCQNFLKFAGVREVKYTNWSGEWETLSLRNI